MNTSYRLFSIVVLVVLAAACMSKKQAPELASDSAEWPELESFHLLMAEAFHPYMDAQDLKPVKQLADTLAIESEKWAASTLPAAMNNEEVKMKLEKLKTDCRTVASLVKQGASDEQVGAALKASHESFHAVMEAWRDRKPTVN